MLLLLLTKLAGILGFNFSCEAFLESGLYFDLDLEFFLGGRGGTAYLLISISTDEVDVTVFYILYMGFYAILLLLFILYVMVL